ncbi:PilZ domain-containing protein [Treponema pectinovorum]|uniref:hypothetical protein n=1 Tax=Treponema pectinovorum TaxID=164 RepID=UPI003D8B41F9
MGSGSPLAARLALNIFLAGFIGLAILALFVALYFISKKVDKYKSSEEYAEKNKNKPTSHKDLNEISKKAHLSKNERELLIKIFKLHPLPNIKFLLKNIEDLEPYFKEQFKHFESEKNEEAKKILFNLKANFQKTFENSALIKNSRLIPIDSILTFTPSKGIHYKFTLIDSNQEELHMRLPKIMKEEDKPEILSKIKLIFVYKDSTPYEMEARVVRYQRGKNDVPLIVCAQTDRIEIRKKRIYPRIDVYSICIFSFAKMEKIDDKTEFTISDKMHDGILADSSAGGCRIITKLPIKNEQHIHIKGPLDGKEVSEAIGYILRTTKNKNDEYILHIKYERINLATVNKISAVAYKYIER